MLGKAVNKSRCHVTTFRIVSSATQDVIVHSVLSMLQSPASLCCLPPCSVTVPLCCAASDRKPVYRQTCKIRPMAEKSSVKVSSLVYVTWLRILLGPMQAPSLFRSKSFASWAIKYAGWVSDWLSMQFFCVCMLNFNILPACLQGYQGSQEVCWCRS